jgi:hypothetical protein
MMKAPQLVEIGQRIIIKRGTLGGEGQSLCIMEKRRETDKISQTNDDHVLKAWADSNVETREEKALKEVDKQRFCLTFF